MPTRTKKNPEQANERADSMLALILSGKAKPIVSNNLADEFHCGADIYKLKQLLNARDDESVEAGAWIASELSWKARPLLNDLVPLLDHPSHGVRFDVLDCVANCVDAEDGEFILAGLGRLNDTHNGVVWKALWFLSVMSKEAVQAALRVAVQKLPSSAHAKGLQLVSATFEGIPAQEIITLLSANDSLLRRYASVAAAKISHHDQSALILATESNDEAIKDFAQNVLLRGIPGAGTNYSRLN